MSNRALRFGVTIQATLAPDQFVPLAAETEKLGFDFLWVTDSSLHGYYVYPYLALAAASTDRIKLGTNCTHPLGCHPALSANAIATINTISHGRAILGVGAGGGPTVELGAKSAKAADVEAMVRAALQLFEGKRVTFEAPEFRIDDGQLMYGLKGLSRPGIYVTASGPRMLEVAGRVADGVLMCTGGTAEGLQFALAHVRAGAESAGRRLEDLDLAWHVFGTFSTDAAEASALGAQPAAMFANAFPLYCELVGIPGETVASVKSAYKGARHFTEAHAAHRLVTAEMIDKLTVSGGPKLWLERIEVARAAGVNHIELFLLGDPSAVLHGLAEQVLAYAR